MNENTGLGTSFGYLWWYGTYSTSFFSQHSPFLLSCLDQASQNNADSNAGWHIPRVRARDNFYAKLEKERIEAQKELLARVAASSSS